jgi:hypothetical protein
MGSPLFLFIKKDNQPDEPVEHSLKCQWMDSICILDLSSLVKGIFLFFLVIFNPFFQKGKDHKCFIGPENPGSKKHEFRPAGTGVPAKAPE